MRVGRIAVGLALVLSSPMQNAHAQPITGEMNPHRSATIATDIGGFALGMKIADVNKVVRVVPLGNNNFEATRDGIAYDFGVTRMGRIYRVSSSQNLKRFAVDQKFLTTLEAQLTAKYGRPTSRSTETFDWALVEPVTRDGQTLPFTTMWASAYVSSDDDGVTVETKLLDFRVMWADEAQLNRDPRRLAEQALKF